MHAYQSWIFNLMASKRIQSGSSLPSILSLLLLLVVAFFLCCLLVSIKFVVEEKWTI